MFLFFFTHTDCKTNGKMLFSFIPLKKNVFLQR
jgi:hypothetical protein